MKRIFLCLLLLVLSAVAIKAFAANPQVTLHTIGAVEGDIVIELYPDKAPITVTNFLDYTRTGFYDGLIFHRVIRDFMIQGGGRDINYIKKTPGPAIKNESYNGLLNLTGTVAMARTNYADTATSEFYINLSDNDFLDYDSIIYNYFTLKPHAQIGYCVFGQVVSGMDVVNDIAVLPTTDGAAPDPNRPLENVIIESATVTSNEPLCFEKLTGDLDGDCDVDTDDLMKLSIQWLNPKCQCCYSADTSKDGDVDLIYFSKMAANWQKCNSITTGCDSGG